jgi:Ca2+-binding RTX toxin-like protein
VVTPAQLGVPSQFWDGPYFTNSGASAIVLNQDNSWIVSFRGTDGADDVAHYLELATGSYINYFNPLLNSIAAVAPAGTSFYFTGASLGGGATNLMADIADAQFAGRFADAKFVAFASPNISQANEILNIGMENDPVYRLINGYSESGSSLDHLVLATSQYMGGNYDGQHPFDTYAHTASGALDAFDRMLTSPFFDLMQPDSVVVFDQFDGAVQDITPSHSGKGAFYIGRESGDIIQGGSNDDFIDAFGGNDILNGAAGNDQIRSGLGNDFVDGGDGADVIYGNQELDSIIGGDGADTIYGGQNAGPADVYGILRQGIETSRGGAGNDLIYGNMGSDILYGDGGDDTIYGGQDNDVLIGGHGSDRLFGNRGDDLIYCDFEDSFGSNDYIDGGDGVDTALFLGSHDQYNFYQADGVTYVGGDELHNIEFIAFADKTLPIG